MNVEFVCAGCGVPTCRHISPANLKQRKRLFCGWDCYMATVSADASKWIETGTTGGWMRLRECIPAAPLREILIGKNLCHIARNSGIPLRTLVRIRNGQRYVHRTTADKVCLATGHDLWEVEAA